MLICASCAKRNDDSLNECSTLNTIISIFDILSTLLYQQIVALKTILTKYPEFNLNYLVFYSYCTCNAIVHYDP